MKSISYYKEHKFFLSRYDDNIKIGEIILINQHSGVIRLKLTNIDEFSERIYTFSFGFFAHKIQNDSFCDFCETIEQVKENNPEYFI